MLETLKHFPQIFGFITVCIAREVLKDSLLSMEFEESAEQSHHIICAKTAVNIVNSKHVTDYTRYLKYLKQDAWKTKCDNYS